MRMIGRPNGNIFVISGPSGSGKTTISNRLLKEVDGLVRAVSFTTRAPRTNEKHGKDYFFISLNEFKTKIVQGDFLEYAQVFGNYYGTDRSWVENILDGGSDVLLSIDVQGAKQIKEKMKNAVLIFLVPSSLSILRHRLLNRATDNSSTIDYRLSMAREEIRCIRYYDYVVINEKIEEAVSMIKAIILAERSRVAKNIKAIEEKFLK